jgi:hypothetical protein
VCSRGSWEGSTALALCKTCLWPRS